MDEQSIAITDASIINTPIPRPRNFTFFFSLAALTKTIYPTPKAIKLTASSMDSPPLLYD